MGVLSWAFADSRQIKTWEAGDSQLTKMTIADLYGIDLSGIADLTRDEAMAIPSVAKIRNRACAKIGGFPMSVLKGSLPYSEPPAWKQTLESKRTNIVTLSWIVDALIFYGRAFLRVSERYSNGKPKYFEFVPEWRAKIDAAGGVVEAWGKPASPADFVRIDGHHEGVLRFGQAALKVAAAVANSAARASDNPVPSIELHQTGGTPLTNPEIDAMVAGWAAARSGKNGGVAYTSQSIEAKVHGQAAEQLLINAQNLADINMARVMGAPAWVVDAAVNGSSITYGNVNARSRELVEDLLQPYMDAITQRLSLDDVLAAGVWCRLDTTDLLRDSFKDEMQGWKSAVDAGIYTAEQVRKLRAGIPLEQAEENE